MKNFRSIIFLAFAMFTVTTQTHGLQIPSNANVSIWGSKPPSFYTTKDMRAFANGPTVGLAIVFTNGSLTMAAPFLGIPTSTTPVTTNAIDVVLANTFGSVLLEDGRVLSWGNQQGLTMPENLSNVVSIAAGQLHVMALKSDGTVVCWGNNGNNQCTVPQDATNIIAIAAGQYFSVALRNDGSVLGWGTESAVGPCYYFPPNLTNITAISASGNYTVALTGSGMVASSTSNSVISTWTNVTQIAASRSEVWGLSPGGLLSNTTNDPAKWPWWQPGIFKIQANLSSRLAWIAGPVILSPATNLFVLPGSMATFSISATSKTDITYQWYQQEKPLSPATTNKLVLTNVQNGDSGDYFAVLTDSFGSITSKVTLVVQGPPIITRHPASATVEELTCIQFASKISSASAYACQWYFNGTPIDDATNILLSLTNTAPNQAGNYYLVASNTFASATSSVAVLTVIPVGSLDQSQQSSCSVINYSAPGQFLAQTFTPAISGRLNRINLPGAIFQSGTPRPVTVHIVDTWNGNPGTNVLGRSLLHLETNDNRILFTNQNVFLEAGHQYAFVLSVDTPPEQSMQSVFPTSCSTNYPGGTGWQKSSSTDWQPIERDFVFTTRMMTGTPPAWIITPQNGSIVQAGKTTIITVGGSFSDYPGCEIQIKANGVEVARSNSQANQFQWIPIMTGTAELQVSILQAGTTITTSDPISVTIIPGTVPENDLFSQRFTIAGESCLVLSSNTGATFELNETPASSNAARHSVWWEWTAPRTGLVTIETRPPFNTNMLISVFTGSALDTLFAMSQQTGRCVVEVDAGTKYQIALDSITGSFSNAPLFIVLNDVEFSFPTNVVLTAPAPFNMTAERTASIRNIQTVVFYTNNASLGAMANEPYTMPIFFTDPGYYNAQLKTVDDHGTVTESRIVPIHVCPASDNYTNGIEITGSSARIITSNRGATRETNDPAFAGYSGGKSIWYHWTSPDDGICNIELCNDPGFNLLIGSFVGDDLKTLEQISFASIRPKGSFSFQAAASITYRLMLDGFNAAEGIIDFALRLQPPHDAFAKRCLLRGTQFSSYETAFSTSLEPGESTIVPSGTLSSLWWSWISPVSGNVRISASSTNVQTQIGVYTGNTLSSLVLLTNSGLNSSLYFHATAGTTYQIGVFIMNSTLGEFSLNLIMDQLRILSPITGSVYLCPARLPISSILDVTDQVVSQVEYYVNGTSIGICTQAPFTLNWTITNAGLHFISAKARTVDNSEFNSSPVSVLIQEGNSMPKPRIFSGLAANSSYAINAVGALQLWGYPAGQFGLASDADTYLPQQSKWPEGVTSWKQIAAVGGGSNLVELPGSSYYVWQNTPFKSWALTPEGVLYENGEVLKPFPPGVSGWASLHGGSSFALTVSSSGSVFVDGDRPLDLASQSIRWLDAQSGRDFIALLDDQGNTLFLSLRAYSDPESIHILHPQARKWVTIAACNDKLILKDDQQQLHLFHKPQFQYTLIPFELPEGVTNWVDFSGGTDHFIALGSNGQIYQWLSSISLGNSPLVSLSIVQCPPGVTAWTAIAAGKNHSLAIGNDCRLYAWGKNNLGQLGSMPLITQPAPVRVSNIDSLCGIPTVFTDGSARQQDDGTFRLRFTTDLNRTYLIQYSDDCQTWKTASQPVTGNGKSLDWIDNGPPLTETPPINKTRFYRVIFAD